MCLNSHVLPSCQMTRPGPSTSNSANGLERRKTNEDATCPRGSYEAAVLLTP